MAAINRLYTFTPNTLVDADQIDAEFDAIMAFCTSLGSVSHVDGSQTFTGVPSLPSFDPTTDNQPVRKRYVDDRVLSSSVVQLTPTGDSSYTANDTWQDWPDGSPDAPLTMMFTKRRSDTKLVIAVTASGYGFTAPGAKVDFGVRIDGFDDQITSFFHNEIQVHEQWLGVREISGRAAGMKTITLRSKTSSITTAKSDANDFYALRVYESF